LNTKPTAALLENPRFIAYCRAMGREPAELAAHTTLADTDPSVAFIAWIRERWLLWAAQSGLGHPAAGCQERAMFDTWLVGTRGPTTTRRLS
jgi:hypothetical protein